MLSISYQNILHYRTRLTYGSGMGSLDIPYLVVYGIGLLPKTIQSSNLSRELKRCYGWTKN